jgi:hypothetical protein
MRARADDCGRGKGPDLEEPTVGAWKTLLRFANA